MRKLDFNDCDVYAGRLAQLRPLPKETVKSLRDFVCFIRDRICETQKELLRLMGESIQLPRDGVNEGGSDGVNDGANLLFETICHYPGKRANELATLVGKSVPSVERYVKSLRTAGMIEFRGASKTGGYYAVEKGDE
jgi:hypothetical protein